MVRHYDATEHADSIARALVLLDTDGALARAVTRFIRQAEHIQNRSRYWERRFDRWERRQARKQNRRRN